LVTPTETAGSPAPGKVTTKDRTNTVRTAK
ncbi:MAG: hypothetical protein RL299_708, partial [Pseudomonadota bacterium]